MKLKTLSLGLMVTLSSCRCAAPSLGPLEDTKPASLGDTGLVIDQPADGASVDAEWVTVSGWVDRSRYAFVAVVGAPSTTFYAPTGHSGIPSVPLSMRADGRFIAPRVPLAVGKTDLLIIAFTSEGTAAAQADRSVNSSSVRTPATMVVSPSEGGRAPLRVTFEPHAATKVENWQWDYDGDGRFDEEGLVGKHTYERAGSYLALARTRIDGQWVMAVAPIQVMGEDDITHQSTEVTSPRAVAVVPRKIDVMAAYQTPDDVLGASDPTSFTQAVLVADGDVVKVFDAELKLVRTLTGLRAPEGAAQDPLGRTYVADTGNNRLVRFLADGTLDSSFGDGGVLSEVRGERIAAPTSILVKSDDQLDGGFKISLEVATSQGVIKCRGLPRCFPPTQEMARRLISTDSAFGGTGDSWLLVGGKLLRSVDHEPLSKGDDVIDAARGLPTSNPWWVVLRPDGRLEERFSTVSNVRVTRLGFPATAIAVDGSAGYVLMSRLSDERSPRVTAPHVIYVAGPGRLERRVLPMMAEGLW